MLSCENIILMCEMVEGIYWLLLVCLGNKLFILFLPLDTLHNIDFLVELIEHICWNYLDVKDHPLDKLQRCIIGLDPG